MTGAFWGWGQKMGNDRDLLMQSYIKKISKKSEMGGGMRRKTSYTTGTKSQPV